MYTKEYSPEGNHWPKSAYGMSKLFLTIHTKFFTQKYPDYTFFSFCPGFTKTDLTNGNGFRSADEASLRGTMLALSTDYDKHSGSFFANLKLSDDDVLALKNNWIDMLKIRIYK